MTHLTKTTIVAISLFILTSFSFGAGFMLGHVSPAQAEDVPAEFNVFWEVWQIVHQHFIDQSMLDPKKLTYGAINGMLDVLGDQGHTRFLPPQESAQQKESISGKFSGIGATVGVGENNVPLIIAPIEGSPAEAAGLQPGDFIIAVDGENVTELQLDEVVKRIRGDAGTKVVLTMYRPSTQKQFDVPIIRGEIKVPAVTWAMVPGSKIAVLRLSQFSANSEEDVIKSFNAAKSAGAMGLILDLRNNPGGLLDQAIRVISQFLKDGIAVLEEDAQKNRTAYAVQPGGVVSDIPMVVLINRGSASASEIFAGAMQDHQRGIVIGEKTFGTGTVLQPFELSDRSTLLLGISQWLTPKGRLIRKLGISPDIELLLPEGAQMLPPSILRTITVAGLLQSQDTQLLKALAELHALPKFNDKAYQNFLKFHLMK